jgi:tetratricopeptide (TPR) repeat protein/O-antigen ligase
LEDVYARSRPAREIAGDSRYPGRSPSAPLRRSALRALDVLTLVVISTLLVSVSHPQYGSATWFLSCSGVACALLRIVFAVKPLMSIQDVAVLLIALAEMASLAMHGFGHNSVVRSLVLFQGVLVYLLVRTLRHRDLCRRWTEGIITIWVGVLSVQAIFLTRNWISAGAQQGFSDPGALKAVYSSVLGGPINEWASVLIAALPFQFALLRPRIGLSMRNVIGMAGILTAGTALFLTFSRGAYLALAIFCVVLGCLVLHLGSGIAKVTALTVGLVLGAGLIANGLSGGAVLRCFSMAGTESQRRSAGGRVQVWKGAIRLAAGVWATGIGPGNFAMYYVPIAGLGQYRPFTGRPLNSAISIAVETGVIGLACWSFLAATVGSASLKRIRSGTASRSSVGLFAGLLALVARELTFSSVLQDTLTSVLFWLGVAIAVNALPKTPAFPRVLHARVAFVLILVLTALSILLSHRSTQGEILIARAVDSFQWDAADRALQQVEAALRLEPENPYYLGLSALAAGHLAISPGTNASAPTAAKVISATNLQRSIRAYQQALAQNPWDDSFWHNLGWLHLLNNDPGLAESHFQRATEIDGGTPAYWISLGLLHERLGENQAALDYALAIAVSPDVLKSSFSRDLKARNSVLWGAAVEEGLEHLRRRDGNRKSPEILARIGRIYLKLGCNGTAREALNGAVAALPQLSRPWAGLAEIELREGRPENAEQLLKKALFLDRGDPLNWASLAEVQRAYGNPEAAENLIARALAQDVHPWSPHAQRVQRIYLTRPVFSDDLLPPGLLAYSRALIEWSDSTPKETNREQRCELSETRK